MAFGTKTNERPGTRAELKFARFSAYKAREVLNLIRGLSIDDARDILEFTERGAAEPVLKLLNSAVANAEHNDGIAGDELYVSACFADEGPTLKRFRPRARGRAGRIRKRTCHITIIVSRYSTAELDERRARLSAKGAGRQDAAASRARRVAASRKSDEAEETSDDVTDDEDVDTTVDEATEVADDAVVVADEVDADATEVEESADDTDDGDDVEDAAEDVAEDDSPDDDASATEGES